MAYTRVPLLRGFTEIKPLFDIAQQFGCTICGGYARYCASPRKTDKVLPASDVDIFPHDAEAHARVLDCLRSMGFEIAHESDMSITLKASKGAEGIKHIPTPQIIKPVTLDNAVTVGSVEEILNNFDFTVVRAAIVSPMEVLVDDSFMEDEQLGILRLKTIKCPVATTLRCCRYVRKGYVLDPSEALKLFEDWSKRPKGDLDVIRKLYAPVPVKGKKKLKAAVERWARCSSS